MFVDTGYWQAVLHPNDQLHQKAIAVSRGLGAVRQVTTEMVLDELLAVSSKPSVRPYAVTGVDVIRSNPNVTVIPQTAVLFQEAFDLYRSRMDKEWSLTDCASFVVMQKMGITEALAYDHHFEQASFVALLRS